MNFQLIEKIRPLVKSSLLLNETERQEWLMLLELMNDKQLVELQRILEPAASKESGSLKQELRIKEQNIDTKSPANQPVSSLNNNIKIPASAGMTQTDKVGEPHLKHILNFPSTPASRHRDVTSEVFVGQNAGSGTEDSRFRGNDRGIIGNDKKEGGSEKKTTGFLSRFKGILAKKELKPGHAEFQLELKDKNVEIPDALKTILHHKDLGHPAVLKKLVESPPHLNPLPQGGGNKEAPLIPRPVKVVTPVAKPKPISFSSPINKFVPGVQLPNLPEGASVKGLDKARPEKPLNQVVEEKDSRFRGNDRGVIGNDKIGIRNNEGRIADDRIEERGEKGEPVRPQLKPSYSSLNLKNLEDAAKLSPMVLESVDINEMVKKIKSLMDSEGYYQTIFSLEKSTLFKQYLLTGLDSLYKEVSVEELAQEHPNQYLTKEQFEKFTDLLMVSQSG